MTLSGCSALAAALTLSVVLTLAEDASRWQAVLLGWPFPDCEWQHIPGSTAHTGPDQHAQDWGRVQSWRAEGSRVLAPIDGRVVAAGRHPFLGEHVVVCNLRYCVLMAHLRVRLVAQGTEVTKGQTLVGSVGRTGLPPSGVAHLHIGVTLAASRGRYSSMSATVPFVLERCVQASGG